MAVRSLLHYALEVPDQSLGQRYYQDFGLVDESGRGAAVRLRPARQSRESVQLYEGPRKRLQPSLLRRHRRGLRPDARSGATQRRARDRSPARSVRRGLLVPRSRRQSRQRTRGIGARGPHRPAPAAQRPRLCAAPGRARRPRARPQAGPEAAGARSPLHAGHRPPGRLLHARARAQAVGPLAGDHRLHAMHDRPPQPRPPRLDGARLPSRVLRGRGRGRDRAERRGHGRSRLAAGLGDRAPRHRVELLLLPSATHGAASRSTSTTWITSRRAAPGSRAISPPRTPSTSGGRPCPRTSPRTKRPEPRWISTSCVGSPSPTPRRSCSAPWMALAVLPRPETGKSELETARMPHLHALAARSACGLLRHVGPGITPGSGPGHLGLFGYDPLRHPVGRGVLEALGIDFPLRPGDVAARGNFCTVDGEGPDHRPGARGASRPISASSCARG